MFKFKLRTSVWLMFAASAVAQRQLPPLMGPDIEAGLAASAAPPAIAKSARIFLLKRGGFVLYREGSNGFTCFVARTVPGEVEPICYLDREETHTLVAREFEEQKLHERGLRDAEVDAEIGRSYREGTLRPPRSFGLAYMLSPCNRVSNKQGKIVAEPPHLMFYAPYATNAELGLTPSHDHDGHFSPFILFDGEPWAFLVVPGQVADPAAERFCQETP
jgi:hypothetical protein